jgi:putative thioredoxin
VRSIPFCVLFDKGAPVDGFVGAQPEAQIRQFLDRHVPTEVESEADAQAEAAEQLEAEGDVEAALAKLQQAVALAPGNDTARCDYVKLLLELGRAPQARVAFEPMAGKALAVPRIAALGLWLAACEKAASARSRAALDAAIAANKRDFDARYELAQTHFAAARFTEAMDALLEIVMRDKEWNEQLARKTYVAILELMTKPAPKPAPEQAKGTLEVAGKAIAASGDPVVDQYRRKLSMAGARHEHLRI